MSKVIAALLLCLFMISAALAQPQYGIPTVHGQSFDGWTTAGRPACNGNYTQGWNTTLGTFDWCNGTIWLQPPGSASDVRTYGAKCDGATDDTAAIQAAINANRAVLPTNQTCYVTSTLTIVGGAGLQAGIVGSGQGSKILAANTVSPIIQIGSPTITNVGATLADFAVTRSGTPPAGSIGIQGLSFNYLTARSVDSENSDIDWDLTGPSSSALSIGAWLDNISASNATTAWLRLTNVAGVHVNQPQFGRNGGEAYAYPCGVILSGPSNGNEFVGGDMIPTGSSNHNSVTLFCFQGETNVDAELWLQHINSENYAYVISSDAATPAVSGVYITGGRFGGAVTQDFFNLNAVTRLFSFRMTGASIGHPMTIPASAAAYWLMLSNVQLPTLSVTGVASTAAPNNAASDLSVSGGTMMHGALTLGGTFSALNVSTNNVGTFNDTSTCSAARPCKNINTTVGASSTNLSVSAISYGADPTGVADSTAAINNALVVTGKTVHLPSGTYLVSNALTLNTGQCLEGDGRGTTTITVPITFSTLASGVLQLTGREQNSPCVRDLAISFQQPASFSTTAAGASASGQPVLTVASGVNSATGYYVYDTTHPAAIGSALPVPTIVSGAGTTSWTLSANIAAPGVSSGDVIQFIAPRSAATPLGSCGTGYVCKFPPAIYSGGTTQSNRFRIRNTSIYGAWDCISAGSNAAGIGGYIIQDVECGAYDVGINLQNGYDAGHLLGYHFWNFGVGGGASTGVYYDGATYAGKFNQVQALSAVDYFSLGGKTYWDGTNSWGIFTNAQLDSGASFMANATGSIGVTINGGYYSSASPQQECAITANSGAYQLVVTGFHAGSIGYSDVCSAGLFVQLSNDTFVGYTPSVSLVSASAGVLNVTNSQVYTSSSNPWTVSPIAVTGTAKLQARGDNFEQAPISGSSPGISIATDNSQNVVTGNSFTGWSFSPPGPLGTYTPNGISLQRLASYTVSALPACNATIDGSLAYVTDAASPTYSGVLTGGGSSRVLALCSLTGWTSH